jgi:hypothetical protein
MVLADAAYEDGTECSETSAHKIQTTVNHQKKKEYNVPNTAKVWNPENYSALHRDWTYGTYVRDKNSVLPLTRPEE